jgi:hypothetical protein
MRSIVLVTFAIVGCNVPTITERPPIAGAHRVPDRIPPASIHAGTIRHVAMTEQADVALSVDTTGEVRFWPSLDGKREPVQLALTAPRAIAIAHAGSELVVAAIDQAGNGQILRLSRDGALRGTTAISGELAIVQLVAIENGVLAVRADQTIERYDVNGVRHGRLVGDSGERFAHLAVRRNGAAVLVIGGTPKPALAANDLVERPTATDVRFIVLGDELATDGLTWGPRRVLPHPVDADAFALAPNHKRIAVLDAASAQLHVLDVGDLHEIGTPASIGTVRHPAIGFTDDDNVAEIDSLVLWWPEPSQATANGARGELPKLAPQVAGGAFGDGLAVAGLATSLDLATPATTRFLGWLDDTEGMLSAAGSGFAVTLRDGKALLLDRNLAIAARTSEVLDENAMSFRATSPLWIDEHHVVIARSVKDHQEVLLVDPVAMTHQVSLGSYDLVRSFKYNPQLRELAMVDPPKVHRVVLDASFTKVTSLPDLASGHAQDLRLVDPATHGGLVAVGVAGAGSYALVEWHDGPGPTIEPVETVVSGEGVLRGIDGDGSVYVADDHELDVVRGGTKTPLGAATLTMSVAPSTDGKLIATVDDRQLAMRDAEGRELWRRTMWDIERIEFASDERRVVVQTSGGLVELDAMTGERITTSCAFDFGIHDAMPQAFPRNTPTACED